MSGLKQIFRGESQIDFRPKWRIALIASASLVVISLGALIFRGLELSIEFEGGAVWEVPASSEQASVSDVEDRIGAIADVSVQEILDGEGERSSVVVKAGVDELDNADAIRAELQEMFDVQDIDQQQTGSQWGDQITRKAVQALILFFIVVALYLAWTLEWRMAVGALAAVFHDLLITAGVYAVFGFEVSPATVIAMLTILGYSIYDTVVVYDKVKENELSPVLSGGRYSDLVNHSMNQVVMRSINTTITTVLPVLSMLIVGGVFLQASGITSFALALFVGLILGTYSSIFLAAPILVWLHEIKPDVRREQEIEERREAAKAKQKRMAKTAVDVEPDSVVSGSIQPKARKKNKR